MNNIIVVLLLVLLSGLFQGGFDIESETPPFAMEEAGNENKVNLNSSSEDLSRIVVPDYQFQGGLYGAVMAYNAENLENENPWQSDLALATLPVYQNGCYDPSGKGTPFGLSEEEMMAKLTETAEVLGLEIYSTKLGTNATKGMDGGLIPGDMVYRITADTNNGRLIAEADGTLIYNIPTGYPLPEEYTFASKGNTEEEAEAALGYLAECFATLLDYDDPEMIVEGSYNRSGQFVRSYRVYDGSSDHVENMLGYNFCYAEFSPDDEGNLMMIRIRNGLTKGEKIGDYPIISVEEAQAKLLAGEYQTSVPASVEDISSVAKADLVYRNGATEETLLPYYRFYVELSNAEGLLLSGTEGMKAYGIYYVPAVQDEYIFSQEEGFQYQ